MTDPTAQGYIVIYSPSAKSAASVTKIIKTYVNFRRFDASRITIITGEKRDIRPILHFWLVPAGAEFQPDVSGIPEPEPQRSVGANPSACELNGLHLHNLRQELANNPNATLEIHYLDGKGESETVSRKRIELSKQFLQRQISAPMIFVRAGKAVGNSETRIFIKSLVKWTNIFCKFTR